MKRLVILAAAVLVLPGCGFFQGAVKKYDVSTVEQIDKTVTYENAVYDLLGAELTKISAAQTPEAVAKEVEAAKLEIKVRHDSEIARLAGWRLYESAKQGAPTPVPTTPATTGGGK